MKREDRIDREEVEHVLHTLRCYATAALLLQTGGTEPLQTTEHHARLQRRLQVAEAAKTELDTELDGFLYKLNRLLETQQTRLDQTQKDISDPTSNDE